MNGPLRFRDDAEFKARTGVDLRAEPSWLSTPNLDALAERLGAEVRAEAASQASKAASPHPTATSPVAGSVGGAALALPKVGALTALAFAAGLATHAVVAPLVTAPKAPVVVVIPLPVVSGPAAPEAQSPPLTTPLTAPVVSPARGLEVRSRAQTPAEGPVTSASAWTLAEQLRLFESGRTALLAGNHAAAQVELNLLLSREPAGALAPEAAELLLRSLAMEPGARHALGRAQELLSRGVDAAVELRILRQRIPLHLDAGACAEARTDLARIRALGGVGGEETLRQEVGRRCSVP